ncbi:MAG: sulfite exporter TauE/SafE family protein [Candidatus Moranbacteria bacterium]|nr:sulfite exporter TauE/SafE family protein [Candidatus Moranbacteria bacterium]
MKKKTFQISGMHCRSCELLTEEALLEVPGVQKAKTNFRTGKAEISYEETAPSLNALKEVVEKIGYKIGGASEQSWFSKDVTVWVETLFAIGIVFVLFVFAKFFGLFDVSFGSPERLESLPFVFLVGLVAGLSTCMAIVGGLTLAISARYNKLHPELGVRQKFVPHVYFNLGRIGGFTVLGTLLGWFGSTFQPSSLLIGVLTVAVGAVMVLIGVQLLELFPRLSLWKLTLPKGIARIFGIRSHTEKEYSHTRTIFLGVVTFFLPCGFTQLAQLFVVTQGSPSVGALVMGVFALGTAPGLLGIGGAAAAVKGATRGFFFKVAGIIVVLLGVFNVQNGQVLVGLGSDEQKEKNIAGENSFLQEPQIIRVTQKANGYFPNQLTVKKGQPVKLIVDSQESYSCAVSFVAPRAGIRKVLSPGENVFEFVPDKTGQIPFSCSMGMYRGVINVVE